MNQLELEFEELIISHELSVDDEIKLTVEYENKSIYGTSDESFFKRLQTYILENNKINDSDADFYDVLNYYKDKFYPIILPYNFEEKLKIHILGMRL